MKYLIILSLFLTSCKSILFTGVETFDFMYVNDGSKCKYQRAVVITRRLSRMSINRVAFYLEAQIKGESVKILIPEMELDPGCMCYHGLCDDVPYSVKYEHKKGYTLILVSKDGEDNIIALSDKNICK